MAPISGLLAVWLLALLDSAHYALAEEAPTPPEKPPPPLKKWTPGTQKNIIFLLTDDQDLRLGSMGAMPFTMEHIMHAGANVSNFFIHTPICCPSRTTLMSGKFVHNNKVRDAMSGGCMRMNTSRTAGGNPSFWEDSFIHRLRYEHGYTTGVFGKLLNSMTTYGCNGNFDVPGLDRGYIMCNPSFFNEKWADYTVDASGHGDGSVHTTGNEPENYTTSLVGNHSLAWIRSVVEMGEDHPPFFAYMGPHAPHLPSTPAPWYADHPVGLTPLPRDGPDWNYSAQAMHAFLPKEPVINAADLLNIEDEHSKRLRSLLSVDDIVREVYAYLVSVDEWKNTFFFYTSDHGYNLGQFRVDSHKTMVYDHTTRVPMLVKGPGIAAGSSFAGPASMADIAPTILQLAGGPPAEREAMDGKSFAPALTGAPLQWKDAVLVEYLSIRTSDTLSLTTRHARDAYLDAYGYRTDPANGEPVWPWVAAQHDLKRQLEENPSAGPQLHWHDGPNNTFSAIRVINATAGIDLLYAEFADVNNPLAWDFAPDQLNFFELYDVSKDYYMLNNIYHTAPAATKAALHARVQSVIKCRGVEQCTLGLSNSPPVEL